MAARRPLECPVQPCDLLRVLSVVYGPSKIRAAAVAETFRRWQEIQADMPRVAVAWCYADGNEPEPLRGIPGKYPWLDLVRLPQYDLDDGCFRKEGLLNFLLRRFLDRPAILTLDADAWSRDPRWFGKVAGVLLARRDTVAQAFQSVRDSDLRCGWHVRSWSSQVLPGYQESDAIQPGLAWGFRRDWEIEHGDRPVFNPWCITGSGDCMFLVEHFPGMGGIYRRRHVGCRYFAEAIRDGLPAGRLGCVPVDAIHQSHTDFTAVPEGFRIGYKPDRAYKWSRLWLDWIDLRAHIALDGDGVPMPVDGSDGPWARMSRRKPEMQTEELTRAIFREEFGYDAP